MELKVSRLDLKLTQKSWPQDLPFAPALVHKRPTENVECWFVVDSPVIPGQVPTVIKSYQDPYVRIPLFQYTLHPDADLAFAYMVQLGLTCAASIPQTVKKLHVVTGFPVDLLYEDGITAPTGIHYWFGFAYVL